jgi:hypothetical protein
MRVGEVHHCQLAHSIRDPLAPRKQSEQVLLLPGSSGGESSREGARQHSGPHSSDALKPEIAKSAICSRCVDVRGGLARGHGIFARDSCAFARPYSFSVEDSQID